MDVLSVLTGAAGVGVLYFLYLCATKGVPVAWAWLKAKWTAGKAGLDIVEQGIEAATTRIDSLEQSLSLFQTELEKLKALLPAPASIVPSAVPAAAPSPAPIAPAPAAPAAAPAPVSA